MFNLVIFGGPGSGKGTQSAKLTDHYGLTHISTGDVLRQEMKAGTELGKIAHTYIDHGHLIPDQLMVRILADEIDRLKEGANGFIFDGYPRTINQAEALTAMLEERGCKVDAVVGLEVPDEELTARLLERGMVSVRADDNAETIGERLQVYHQTTQPLKEYYIREGIYRAIPGTGSIDDIFNSIKAEIEACQTHPTPNA